MKLTTSADNSHVCSIFFKWSIPTTLMERNFHWNSFSNCHRNQCPQSSRHGPSLKKLERSKLVKILFEEPLIKQFVAAILFMEAGFLFTD